MSERPDGYYWVRHHDEWKLAISRNGLMYLGIVPFSDGCFDEIGPPCSRDDAEQLRLAREVLRKIQCEFFDFKTACKLKNLIDESGVRL
jgi:hypothetical protein